MIALFLLAYVLFAFFAVIAVFQRNLKLHIVVITVMYGFYGWLWYERLYLLSDARPAYVGISLILSTIFTAPLYIIYHLLALFKSDSPKNRAIIYLNITGLLICLLHLIYVFS